MSDADQEAVTRILSDASIPPDLKADQLIPLVYEELRRLAAMHMSGERKNHTLQPTALVNEACLRLLRTTPDKQYNDQRHFFNAAAEAMRRILIEHARRTKAQKRGGDRRRIDLESMDLLTAEIHPDQIVALDAAFERFNQEDGLAGEIIRLRVYAGLTAEQVGEALGVSRRTVLREWQYARAVIFRYASEELSDDGSNGWADSGAPQSDNGS